MATRRSAATPHPQTAPGPAGAQQQRSTSLLPEDDDAAARYIIATKTHYEALLIGKSSTDTEIKASYRKLALRFHPDRCKAKQAEEAFKAISAAYSCLMDPKTRQTYDLQQSSGATFNRFSSQPTGPQFSQGGQGMGARTFRFSSGQTFGEDVSAEDLFNMFFFQGRPQQNRQQQQRQQQQQRGRQGQTNDGDGWMQFLHFLPLIIMLLFTMLSMMPSQEAPKYSMERYGKYSVPYSTKHLKVPFYVTLDVHNSIVRESTLSPSLQRVDINSIFREVEDEHIEQWKGQCMRALSRNRDNSSKICTDWTSLNEVLTQGRRAEKEGGAPLTQPSKK